MVAEQRARSSALGSGAAAGSAVMSVAAQRTGRRSGRGPVRGTSAGPAMVAAAEMGRAGRGRRARWNGVLGLLVLVAALFHAWTGLQVWQVGYQLGRARDLTIQLEQQRQELQVEYAAATAGDRLAKEAIARLGLEPASADRVIHVAETLAGAR